MLGWDFLGVWGQDCSIEIQSEYSLKDEDLGPTVLLILIYLGCHTSSMN